MKMQATVLRFILPFLLCLPLWLGAQPPTSQPRAQVPKYKVRWGGDLAITLGSGAYYGAITAWDVKQPLLTQAEILALRPADIAPFDRMATMQYSSSWKTTSDIGLYLGMASPALLMLDPNIRANSLELGMLALEAFVVNLALTQTAKVFARRLRPFMYNPDVPMSEKLGNRDATHSFWSGHASASASMSFFTAKVFSDYYPNSPWRFVVWGGAITLPAITAIARVGAGKHFPTDVMVGYVTGALVGLLVPELHRIISR